MVRPPGSRSRRVTVIIGVVAAASWLVAASGRLAWAWGTHGRLPVSLIGLTWPRGEMVGVRHVAALVAIVFTAVLVQRLANRAWLTAVACVPLVLAGSWIPVVPYPGVVVVFQVWRPVLLEAREVLQPAATTYTLYGPDLPESLSELSVTGFVHTRGDGSILFPQWAGIPDDAGGYWYVPGDGSPAEYDMWGMPCTGPLMMEPHWWSCGIREEAGGRW